MRCGAVIFARGDGKFAANAATLLQYASAGDSPPTTLNIKVIDRVGQKWSIYFAYQHWLFFALNLSCTGNCRGIFSQTSWQQDAHISFLMSKILFELSLSTKVAKWVVVYRLSLSPSLKFLNMDEWYFVTDKGQQRWTWRGVALRPLTPKSPTLATHPPNQEGKGFSSGGCRIVLHAKLY